VFRAIALSICLAVAGLAGWQVWYHVSDVFEGWIPYAAGGLALAIVLPIFYFPLARPIADVIHDRMSALNQMMKKSRQGTGIDEVPIHRDMDRITMTTCAICGGPVPVGSPVCDKCHRNMSGS